jgi:hypothetical protein
LRVNHKWTDEERTIIRRSYRHTHASAQNIAKMLGVTEFAIIGQVTRMGIAKRDDRRPWTNDEKEKLAELISRYCPQVVAQKMHRSINSVVVMSKRLNISRRHREGWFTKKEVMEILGVDHKWVQRRIDSGALRASWHYGIRPGQLGGSAWHIAEEDLKDFIRRYPEELNGHNCDMMMIVEILAGVVNGQKR